MTAVRRARMEDAHAIASVWAESWRDAYRGIVPDDYLNSIDVERWADRQRRYMGESHGAATTFVAEVDGRIVGWTSNGPNRDTSLPFAGELYTLYISPEHQRRGIGRRLMKVAAKSLVEAGMASMLLWVLADNRNARRFYEAAGGRVADEQHVTFGGASLREVAYGWEELTNLASQ